MGYTPSEDCEKFAFLDVRSYPLVMTNTLRTGKWYIWFVDLPIKDGDVPVRNVSLPRVNPIINQVVIIGLLLGFPHYPQCWHIELHGRLSLELNLDDYTMLLWMI